MKEEKQYEKFKILYEILQKKYEEGKYVTSEEILKTTNWKESTFNTYYSKKLKNSILFAKSKGNYEIKNIDKYDEVSFLRLMSQNQNKSEKPFKRELKERTEQLLEKAIDSAYLAVDIYNRPQTKFRTEGYLVMMIIAWTSLLHSIFEENNIDYFYKDKDGNNIIINGDNKAWELGECAKYYNLNDAIKKNLEFSILLRNKIEHRFVPEIDLDVCSECHALLYNFENLLDKEYGKGYSLADKLFIPLQFTRINTEETLESKRKFQSENFGEIKEFITKFRESLDDSIYNSMEYSFKVYLVPKTVNRQNKADLSIEFINFNPQEEKNKDIKDAVAIIKQKTIQVANQGKYKPSTVVKLVEERSGKTFSIQYHTNAWKYYGIRESNPTPDKCNTEYCQYDEAHRDIVYNDKWVDKLVIAIQDEEIYNKIKTYNKKNL